jgi:hypothetical protein
VVCNVFSLYSFFAIFKSSGFSRKLPYKWDLDLPLIQLFDDYISQEILENRHKYIDERYKDSKFLRVPVLHCGHGVENIIFIENMSSKNHEFRYPSEKNI